MEQNHKPPAEGLYRPRAGEFVNHYVDILMAPPDRELTPEQRAKFLEFENDLMDGKHSAGPEGQKVTVLGVELPFDELNDQTSYTKDRAELSLDYFLTAAGQQALMNLGVIEAPTDDRRELSRKIRATALSMPQEKLKDLQVISEKYVDEQTAEAIAEGRDVSDPERIRVFCDGTKLMRRAGGLRAYKDFYRQVSRDLNTAESDGDNLLAAKKAVLRMYRRKVNAFLASMEPNLLEFWRQIEDMDEGNDKDVLKKSAAMVWPPVERVETSKEAPSIKRFIVRLDRIRNGASLDERSKYTAVSQELEDLFKQNRRAETKEVQPAFSPEEIALLDETKFDANQMQAYCKFLLANLGKLSLEPEETYSPDRPARAADGKWQVPIREDVDSMSTEDPPGAFAIPAKFNRNLTKAAPPVGAIPGALHEIKHVSQNDNYRNNTRGMKLGKQMKGKGSLVLREAGTLDVERQVQQRLFGRGRPTNPHHLQAIKALENGGSEIDAVRAFYASYLESNPAASNKTAAQAAVRGVKRTARRQGGFDSQALDYAESTLIFESARRLDERAKNIIFAESSFGLEDLAELHRFGLLEGQTLEEFPLDKLLDLTVEYMRKIISKKSGQTT